MVFFLTVVGPLVAGLAIIKAIITLGAEMYLCNKSSKALKRNIEELGEQLVLVKQEHPAAAAEVTVLQLRLERAAENIIREYQSKGLLRRICTATKHLEYLDEADKEICTAVESLLAKLEVPNEVMSIFYKDHYARRHERSFWSILFKAKPVSVAKDAQRGVPHRVSPPPSPSPLGRTIRRRYRRLAKYCSRLHGKQPEPLLVQAARDCT